VTASLTAVAAARRIVAGLLRGGVQDVVVSPGSRSAPMAYALAEAEAAGAVRLHVRSDERVAAFTALGLSLGAQRPAAVLTTSGTAAGELLPAVMEANHAAVPLVVLTADRPAELRGTGANQTTHQPGLYGVHIRCALDIAAGEDPAPGVAAALAAAVRSGALPPGPVHLNLAFRDPLVPGEHDGDTLTSALSAGPAAGTEIRDAAAGSPHWAAPRPGARPDGAARPAGQEPANRTVVVAGHGAGEIAAVFAQHLGLPLLAEPSSNARFGPTAVAPYRLLLEHLGSDVRRVVVFGRPTLSRPVAALLARQDVETALYLPEPAAWFQPGRRPGRTIADPGELLDFAGPGAPGWLERWRTAGAAAESAIRMLLEAEPALTGLHVADAVWEHSDGNLVLGSSNPVRDMDLMASTDWHPLEVYANRGLAGIDGTVSTATGIALAAGIPTRLLAGDLTFLHDSSGLLLHGEPEPNLQIVVLNDSGGGIFGLLEHGDPALAGRYGAAVERLFGTPHSVGLGALAAAYGVRHTRAATMQQLEAALSGPVSGRSIVEVPADRAALRSLHARIRESAARVVSGL
jgi:2-succinyl-5-enolpyruvyl-6-hydroxy-3-cyclohexene-1-carboxylate synthase